MSRLDAWFYGFLGAVLLTMYLGHVLHRDLHLVTYALMITGTLALGVTLLRQERRRRRKASDDDDDEDLIDALGGSKSSRGHETRHADDLHHGHDGHDAGHTDSWDNGDH